MSTLNFLIKKTNYSLLIVPVCLNCFWSGNPAFARFNPTLQVFYENLQTLSR